MITVLHTGTRPILHLPPGVRVLHAPMLTTRALPYPSPFEGVPQDTPIALVLTSVHGVRALKLPTTHQEISWWVVGSKTKQALLAKVDTQVSTPPPEMQNVDGLLDAMMRDPDLPQDIIILGLRDSERALHARLQRVCPDRRIRHLDAYETTPNQGLHLQEIVGDQTLDIVLWTSPRGVRALDLLTPDDALRQRILSARQVAIGPTTAAAMPRVDEIMPTPNIAHYLEQLPQG